MAFRYSRSAMTGAAIFTLAGVTVLPLAQANAAPASSQDEARSGATQGQPNSAAQSGQDQGQQTQGATQDQQQSANAGGQGQQAQGGATQVASDGSSQSQQQGANASQDDSNSASQNDGQRQVGQPSAPVESIFVVIDSVDGFIDPQKTDNALNVRGVWYDNNPSFNYSLTVQELDEFGNVVDDDVSTTVGGSSISSDGHFDLHVNVDGTKINPNHQYRVYIDVFDRDTLTASYAYYPIVVWNRTYIPVVPLSAAR